MERFLLKKNTVSFRIANKNIWKDSCTNMYDTRVYYFQMGMKFSYVITTYYQLSSQRCVSKGFMYKTHICSVIPFS